MKRGTCLIITMEDYTEPTGLIGITHYVPIREPFIELNYTYVIVIDTNINHTQILNTTVSWVIFHKRCVIVHT